MAARALQTIEMPALTDADDVLIIRTNPQLRHIAFDSHEHADTFLVVDNRRYARSPATRVETVTMLVGRSAELGSCAPRSSAPPPATGKTTLVDTFVAELDGRPDMLAVRGLCVEQHRNSDEESAVSV